MRVVMDILPQNALLARFMIGNTWSYDSMTVLIFEGTTVHIKGWIGKPPTKDMFQCLSDNFPEIKTVKWERIKSDDTVHVVELPLPKPNPIPESKIILNPIR